MFEREVLTATDEWIKNLKNLLPSVSSENQEYVQSRIGLLERLQEQAERVQELENHNKRYREAIERALDESVWGDEGNALHRTISILAKALEGDDD